MKKGLGEEQFIYALKRIETGGKELEICRELGISKHILYNWKRKCSESGVGTTITIARIARQTFLLLRFLTNFYSKHQTKYRCPQEPLTHPRRVPESGKRSKPKYPG
jgi:hypothetical protein